MSAFQVHHLRWHFHFPTNVQQPPAFSLPCWHFRRNVFATNPTVLVDQHGRWRQSISPPFRESAKEFLHCRPPPPLARFPRPPRASPGCPAFFFFAQTCPVRTYPCMRSSSLLAVQLPYSCRPHLKVPPPAATPECHARAAFRILAAPDGNPTAHFFCPFPSFGFSYFFRNLFPRENMRPLSRYRRTCFWRGAANRVFFNRAPCCSVQIRSIQSPRPHNKLRRQAERPVPERSQSCPYRDHRRNVAYKTAPPPGSVNPPKNFKKKQHLINGGERKTMWPLQGQRLR